MKDRRGIIMQYIKECRPQAIVQYEQYILQRNTKMKDKEDEEYYKLEDKWNISSSLLRS